MINIFRKFFPKKIVAHTAFHTGTSGTEKHREFIKWVNEANVEIINSFIEYHDYSNSHKPAYIHYVIKYKKL